MNKPQRPQPPELLDKANRIAWWCVLVMFGGFSIGLSLAIKSFIEEGDWEIVGLFGFLILLFVGIFLVMPLCYLVNDRKKAKRYKEQLEQYELELQTYERENPYYKEKEFYLWCKNKYKIEGTSVADVARMKLALKEFGFNWREQELAEKYLTGQREATEEAAQKKKRETEIEIQNKIQTLLETQKKEQSLIKSRLRMTGVSKRIEYIEKRLRSLKEDKNATQKAINNTVSLGLAYKKSVDVNDSDWAIAGGMAQAIGGPIAGMAAASQAYERGEKERREKVATADKLNDMITQSAMSGLDKISDIRTLIDSYEKKLSETQCLLTADNIPQTELIALIKPQNEDIKITQVVPGLVSFETATKKATITIYETVDASLDGFFKFVVRKNNTVILENYCELSSQYGSSVACHIKGYVTGTETDNFTFDFVPVNLWAIENK